MANQWFRMYAEFATDPKVQMMSETLQRRFVMLLCLRCNANETFHETMTDEIIAFQLRISDDEWQATKQVFTSKNMLTDDNELVNWDKRQFISDSSTERVRKHRDHKKETKQQCNVSVTPPDTETDTDTDIESTIVDSCPEAQAQPDSNHPETDDVVVFEMPVKAVKKGEGNVFCIRQSHVDHFKELFPDLDIMQELKTIMAWNESRPAGSRKTGRGFIQHVTNWLIRSQNKIRPASRASPVNSQYPQQPEQPRPKEFDPTTIFGEDFRIDYAATEH